MHKYVHMHTPALLSMYIAPLSMAWTNISSKVGAFWSQCDNCENGESLARAQKHSHIQKYALFISRTHQHTHMRARMYMHTRLYMHTLRQTPCTHIRVRALAHARTYTRTRTHIHLHTCLKRTCNHTLTQCHIHTHTHC